VWPGEANGKAITKPIGKYLDMMKITMGSMNRFLVAA